MSKRYRIEFKPLGVSSEVDPDETIMAGATGLGDSIRFDRGVLGICGKCRVSAEPAESLSPLTSAEMDLLSPREIATGRRLASQAGVRDFVTVTIDEEPLDSRRLRVKSIPGVFYPLSPMVERFVLPADPTTEMQRKRIVDKLFWIVHRSKEFTGREITINEVDVLRQLSVPEISAGEITLVNHEKKGITAILPGSRNRNNPDYRISKLIPVGLPLWVVRSEF